jgi:predicted RNase H-like HicB family nuclease
VEPAGALVQVAPAGPPKGVSPRPAGSHHVFTQGARPDLPLVNLPSDWSDDDGIFVARVPALGPGGMAHVKTQGEATQEAKAVAALLLDVLREDRKPIPPEDASPCPVRPST